jgi:hypothetical protein
MDETRSGKVKSDDEYQFIFNLLKDGEAFTGKDVAREARKIGLDWAREHANSRLYTLWRNGKLLKIETSKAPLWTLPEFQEKHEGSINGSRIPKVVFTKKKLPLVADESMTIEILDIKIEFAFNDEMSSNDPYMFGDWLEDKIFVSLNRNHPFWETFIENDIQKSLQLTNIALEVYAQWYIAKMQAKVTPQKLLEIRDKAMRDISLK